MLERVVESPQAVAESLAACLAHKRRILVLTGAGISVEAGIPDYRDADGAWKHRAPVDFHDFVTRAEVRRRYWARSYAGWPAFAAVHPAAGHRALAGLERSGRLMGVITQNVDGLHRRADSRRVVELHGRLSRVRCLGCRASLPRSLVQDMLVDANPRLGTPLARLAPDGDADIAEHDFSEIRAPDCSNCGGILKPDVTFYGEPISPARTHRAKAAVDAADALLVVGSSLMVFSAFSLVRIAASRKIPVLAVNLGRTRADALIDLKVIARAGVVLPLLARLLGVRAEDVC